jgi:hypothetical protein
MKLEITDEMLEAFNSAYASARRAARAEAEGNPPPVEDDDRAFKKDDPEKIEAVLMPNTSGHGAMLDRLMGTGPATSPVKYRGNVCSIRAMTRPEARALLASLSPRDREGI